MFCNGQLNVLTLVVQLHMRKPTNIGLTNQKKEYEG